MTTTTTMGDRRGVGGAVKEGRSIAVAWKRSRRGLSEMARAQWISRCVSYGRSLSLPCTPFPRSPTRNSPPPFHLVHHSFLLHDLLLHRAALYASLRRAPTDADKSRTSDGWSHLMEQSEVGRNV